MSYTVGLAPGVTGPGEMTVATAREALTHCIARRKFGQAIVRDTQGREVSEATLRKLAGEEDAADRAKLRSDQA